MIFSDFCFVAGNLTLLFWGKLTRLPNTDGSLGMAGMMREMDAKNIIKKKKVNSLGESFQIVYMNRHEMLLCCFG